MLHRSLSAVRLRVYVEGVVPVRTSPVSLKREKQKERRAFVYDPVEPL